jgi:hypothetical protein
MLNNLKELETLISLDYVNRRDYLIYTIFNEGCRQKTLSKITGLSESRVKAICNQQRRIENANSK